MAPRIYFSAKSVVIALIIALLVSLTISFKSCQQYIAFDVSFPSNAWIHLYTCVGPEPPSYYKAMKVDSSGKSIHVKIPLLSMLFDSLILRIDRPGGIVTFNNIKIINGREEPVKSINPVDIETSSSGTPVVSSELLQLTPTGLSDILDIRINYGQNFPLFPPGTGLLFLKMFLVWGVISYILLEGLRYLIEPYMARWHFPPEKGDSRRSLQFMTLGLFLVILGARLFLVHSFGSDLPYWDQWDAEATYLYLPYFNGTLSLHDLFIAHNEHRIPLAKIAALALLIVNGKWDPLIQMSLNASIYAAVGAFVFRIMRISSSRFLWPGFIVLIFSLPFGWQNTLGGFQVTLYIMIGLSLLFIWFMECRKSNSGKWIWVGFIAILLLFTIASGFLVSLAILPYLAAKIFNQSGTDRLRGLLPAFVICLIMTVSGWLLKVDVPSLIRLKASSTGEFVVAAAAFLGWPLTSIPISAFHFSWALVAMLFCSALLLWCPFLLLFIRFLKTGDPTCKVGFIVSTGFWVILQASAAAYARGGVLLPPSRYQDIFAIGLAVNFAAILYLFEPEVRLKGKLMVRIASLLWLLGTFGGLTFTTGLNIVHNLPEKHTQQKSSLEHVKAYLASGDIKSLEGKPSYDLPYPDKERLALLLSNKDIRRSLSATITGSADKGRLRPLTNLLLDGSLFLILSGLVCYGLYMKLTITRKAPTEKRRCE